MDSIVSVSKVNLMICLEHNIMHGDLGAAHISEHVPQIPLCKVIFFWNSLKYFHLHGHL